MNIPWIEIPIWAAMLVGFVAIVFFSARHHIMFGRRLKENRAAGVYADPEFKRLIRPLNIMRYGILAVQLLIGAVGVWAIYAGIWTESLMYVFVLLLLALLIPGLIVERRWYKLMREGAPKERAPEG